MNSLIILLNRGFKYEVQHGLKIHETAALAIRT
jgi:hypothetical protein